MRWASERRAGTRRGHAVTPTVFDMTTTTRPTISDMEARARKILTGRGIDPDSLADQGDLAADLGVNRRSITHIRRMYSSGARGTGRRGRAREPYPDRALESFPAPSRFVGRSPVWQPRWRVLAWHLTREQTRTTQTTDQEQP